MLPRTIVMAIEIATATIPTEIETRPPYTRRAQTSRPNLSVPSGCSQVGFASVAPTNLIGPCCVRSGAATTAAVMKMSSIKLASATRCRAKRRQTRLRQESGAPVYTCGNLIEPEDCAVTTCFLPLALPYCCSSASQYYAYLMRGSAQA